MPGFFTVFVVERGYFSEAWFHDRDIRGEDRVFLDDLVQKQNQEGVRETDPIVIQNVGEAAMIGSGNDPVPRAELVVNSQIVKRAELVVHSETVKRAGLGQGRQ
ncbi:MAG: hypothetical protein JOZ21_05795 [Verrucomicrobia bacterium]|nr:hypothetical protein [Verrucomicrobiota bacterium]